MGKEPFKNYFFIMLGRAVHLIFLKGLKGPLHAGYPELYERYKLPLGHFIFYSVHGNEINVLCFKKFTSSSCDPITPF